MLKYNDFGRRGNVDYKLPKYYVLKHKIMDMIEDEIVKCKESYKSPNSGTFKL